MNDVACVWVFQKRLKIGVGRRFKAFLGLFLTDWGAFLASEHIAINMDTFWTPILIGLGSLMCTRAKLMSTKMVAPEGKKKLKCETGDVRYPAACQDRFTNFNLETA